MQSAQATSPGGPILLSRGATVAVAASFHHLIDFVPLPRQAPVHLAMAMPNDRYRADPRLPRAALPERAGSRRRGLSAEPCLASCFGEAAELVSCCQWAMSRCCRHLGRNSGQGPWRHISSTDSRNARSLSAHPGTTALALMIGGPDRRRMTSRASGWRSRMPSKGAPPMRQRILCSLVVARPATNAPTLSPTTTAAQPDKCRCCPVGRPSRTDRARRDRAMVI